MDELLRYAHEAGAVVLRRRMKPTTIVEFTGKHRPCTIAEKAFCGAHYLGRELMAQGHDERLKPPEYVHACRRGGPYVFMDVGKDGIAPHEADDRALHRRVHTLS